MLNKIIAYAGAAIIIGLIFVIISTIYYWICCITPLTFDWTTAALIVLYVELITVGANKALKDTNKK